MDEADKSTRPGLVPRSLTGTSAIRGQLESLEGVDTGWAELCPGAKSCGSSCRVSLTSRCHGLGVAPPSLHPLSTCTADKCWDLAEALSFISGLWQQLRFDCSSPVNFISWFGYNFKSIGVLTIWPRGTSVEATRKSSQLILDDHSCNRNQAHEKQQLQPSFVELFQQEEFRPADLGLAVGRVPEFVNTLSL